MIDVIRWTAVILAVIGLFFALRWPRKLPYRNTAVLGGFAALAIAGSPLLFSNVSPLMEGGTALGVFMAAACCWTVVQASRNVS
jgi:hypothetical protein